MNKITISMLLSLLVSAYSCAQLNETGNAKNDETTKMMPDQPMMEEETGAAVEESKDNGSMEMMGEEAMVEDKDANVDADSPVSDNDKPMMEEETGAAVEESKDNGSMEMMGEETMVEDKDANIDADSPVSDDDKPMIEEETGAVVEEDKDNDDESMKMMWEYDESMMDDKDANIDTCCSPACTCCDKSNDMPMMEDKEAEAATDENKNNTDETMEMMIDDSVEEEF